MKLLVVCILLFSSIHLPAEEVLFRSNSIGMALEKISRFQTDNYEYVLKISGGEEGEPLIKILQREGREYKKWVESETMNGKSVLYSEEGKKQELSEYTTQGILQKAFIYDETEEIEEEREYVYADGKLREVKVYDATGEEIYRQEYELGKYGRLRKIEKIYPEQNLDSHYVFSPNEVAEEWHGRQDKTDHFRFGEDHKVRAQEYWIQDVLAVFTEYTYKDENLDYSVSIDYSTNIITETWYTSNDLEKRVLRKSEGTLVSETEYDYDEDSNVREKKVWSPGLRERWEYTYKNEEALDTEKYYRNKVLISSIDYINENLYYEYLYRDDAPFIRIEYIEDEKTKETILIGESGE